MALLGCRCLSAQTHPGVLEQYATSRGGAAYLVVAQGGYLYVAEGSSLAVYDTKEPLYPRVFERRFGSPICDMRLHRGFLYVAAGADGLSKWDLRIPIRPSVVGEYKPPGFFTLALGLDFAADTVYLAAGDGTLILKESGGLTPGFEKLGVLGEQLEGRGRIVAGLHFGKYYAAVIAGKERGIGQGIHTYHVDPPQRLNFHHYDSAEPGRLLLLAEAKRLLVCGGPAFAEQSHLMGLNVADARHPALYRCDTVWGPWGQACVGPGTVEGHLLLLPVRGWVHQGCDSLLSRVLVYDIADPAYMKVVGQVMLPGSVHHLALDGHRLHCALGEEGVLTLDWAAFHPGKGCQYLPELGRSRPNGGFCIAADMLGDRMLVAEGVAGCRLHQLQDRKTIALRFNAQVGTVRQVRLLADGLHAACWVAAPTGDSLVVVGLADGQVVGSLPGPLGTGQVAGWADRVVCGRADRSGFDLLDLRDPKRPRKERSVLVNFNDFACDEVGRLVVTTEHNIRVFDLVKGGFAEPSTFSRWGEGFEAVAAGEGYVYVHARKRGALLRLKLDRDSKGALQWKEDLAWKPPHPSPEHMAVDAMGLYLGYNDFGVYALDKSRFQTKGYYRTALASKGQKSEGLRDLFCAAGKVAVVEYYGQVTILQRTDLD